MTNLRKEINHTLSYFGFFKYPPTLHELLRYLRIRANSKALGVELENMLKENIVFISEDRFAQNIDIFRESVQNRKNSIRLQHDLLKLLPQIVWIPSILFVGISGSLSMSHADNDADIDLFIITKKHSIWITRFLVLIITRLLSLLGNRTASKLCWNLMLEEDHLGMPPEKQNEYIAHEILQLKPVYNTQKIYERFLSENRWVTTIFPNVQIKSINCYNSYRKSLQSKIDYISNKILRSIQLFWLGKKGFKVTEYAGQTWFIQQDVESSIPLKLRNITGDRG